MVALEADIAWADGDLTPRYRLQLDTGEVCLNDCLGMGVTVTYLNVLQCLACSKDVTKLYGGGYCYACFSTLARCDLCVVSPERCHFHAGTCREPDWGESFCMQPHYVYIANTSGCKVGITRCGREYRRWLDQGATQALLIAQTPTRRAAGLVEDFLRRYISDRTDWRKMVTGSGRGADLGEVKRQLQREYVHFDARNQVIASSSEMAQVHWLDAAERVSLTYPIQQFSPAHRYTLSAEEKRISDNLGGVIGQYLLLQQGVLNLADYRGKSLHIELGAAVTVAAERDQMSLF